MPLRDVQPLNDEQWAIVVKALKNGPTDEQKQFVKNVCEYFKDLEAAR